MLPGRGPGGFGAAAASLLPSLLFALFIFSPIGSFVFAIFNSFLLLAVSVPLLLFLAFQIYVNFFTVQVRVAALSYYSMYVLLFNIFLTLFFAFSDSF